MRDYSPNRDAYRIYKRSENSLPQLGYAVSSDLIYRLGKVEDSYYKNAFFGYYNGSYSYNELEWAQYVELNGAIVDDDAKLPSSFAEPKKSPDVHYDSNLLAYSGIRRLYIGKGLRADYYLTASGDGLLPSSSKAYSKEGVGYFINHYTNKSVGVGGSVTITKDRGKLAFNPTEDEYFNEDPNGCYFEFHYFNTKSKGAPRIYALGDTFDEKGNITAENVCLSFDHYLLPNAANTDYYCRESCTFGLYAKGRVKQFVVCYGGSGTVDVSLSNVYMSVFERSDIEAQDARHKAEALRNVKKGVNDYTFDTAYETDRIVVTQLGFDQGWNVTATLPSGEKKACQMLRLDGGLVGFVAPGVVDANGKAQTVTYAMEYKTPYSNLSTACWILGALSLSGIVITQFYFAYKSKKKEQAELALPQE